jgi:hypothetical protein
MSSDDLHAMTGPQLRDRTRDLVAERNRIDAELARTVRVADSKKTFAADGQATAASWLRGHCRLSKSAAAQVVRTGRASEQLPTVDKAHAAGGPTPRCSVNATTRRSTTASASSEIPPADGTPTAETAPRS